MGGFVSRIKAWWDIAGPNQRMMTLAGGAFLLLLLVGTYMIAGRPKYELLYGGLSEAEQSAIVQEVSTMGIPVRYDTPGRVEVPADKKATVRMRLANTGKVPKTAHMGNEGLDKLNLMTTPAVERERLKAILEGELAKSIETVDGVQSARVHVTLGDSSPFVDRNKPAAASINILQIPGAEIGPEQGKGIAMLVANAVEGLSLKNVAVLNQRMEFLFNGQEHEGTGMVASQKISMEEEYSRRRAVQLQAFLDGIYGAGTTRVMVQCELDLDQHFLRDTAYDVSNKPIEQQTMKETMDGDSPAGGGLPNLGGGLAAGAGAAGRGTYAAETTSVRRLPQETYKEIRKATGSVKSLSINVVADKAKFETPADEEKLRSIIAAEIENRNGDASFTTSVQTVEFDRSAEARAMEVQKEAAGQARMQQILSILPIAALIVVAFLVVRQLGKVAKGGLPVLVMGPGGALPMPQGAYAGGGGAAVPGQGGPRVVHHGAPSPQVVQAPGQPAPANVLQGFQEAAAAAGEKGGVHFTSGDQELIEIEEIRDKIHVPLEQIKKMAADKPEVVAMLIKSWVLEERR
jgi:flagellar M-ring protein FliF